VTFSPVESGINKISNMKRSMKVSLTGACGKIAYSLFTPLCSGTILGADVEIELRLVDISSKRDELRILK
jgi:hypothetical protein